MKKLILLSSSLLVLTLTACKDNEVEKAKKEAKDFNSYVDSIERTEAEYSEENWRVIDMGYQERAMKAEAALAKLQHDDSIQIEESKSRYEDLRDRYTEILAKNKELRDQRIRLRNSLFGEGKIGEDISFSFVDGKNAYPVYRNFVETVSKNKDAYSREDWDEIKVLYEALDTRKNEIEKELSSSDNMKIAGLKVRFSAIKATNRPDTKVEENSAAKEE